MVLGNLNVTVLSHSNDEAHVCDTVTGPQVELTAADCRHIDAIDREFRAWDGRTDRWNQPQPARFN